MTSIIHMISPRTLLKAVFVSLLTAFIAPMAYAQDTVSRFDEDYEDLGVGTLYYNHSLDSLDQAVFSGWEKAMYDFVMDQFRWPPRSFEARGTSMIQF